MTDTTCGETSALLTSRRGFLRMGLMAAAGVAASTGTLLQSEEAMAAEFLSRTEMLAGRIGGPRTLSFKNTHTGEELVTTYWRGGSYEQAALDEINYILRDFRSGDVHPINKGLLNLISVVKHRLGVDGRQVNIISGYRSPRTNALLRRQGHGVAERSFHLRGMAIDIRMPGVSTSHIAREARRLGIGGVGYYSSSDFCHVDVGPTRTW